MIQHLNPSSQNVSKRKRDAPKTSNICLCIYIYTHRYTYMYTILYIYYIYMYYYITYIYIISNIYIILYIELLYLISLVLTPMVFRVPPPFQHRHCDVTWTLILQGDGEARGQSHLSHLATVFFRLWDDDHRCPKFPLVG